MTEEERANELITWWWDGEDWRQYAEGDIIEFHRKIVAAIAAAVAEERERILTAVEEVYTGTNATFRAVMMDVVAKVRAATQPTERSAGR